MLEHLSGAHSKEPEFFSEQNASALGRLYGTIGQNYAFCGPEYLEVTEDYLNKAMNIFGDGRKPHFLRDWQQDLCYLIYAYLDAGRWARAKELMIRYLGIEDWNEAKLPIGAPFQHALMARYLVETQDPAAVSVYWPQALDWLKNCHFMDGHPYQLWQLRIPEQSGLPFRSNPATDSGPKRPPIPIHSGHSFRSNPATLSHCEFILNL